MRSNTKKKEFQNSETEYPVLLFTLSFFLSIFSILFKVDRFR